MPLRPMIVLLLLCVSLSVAARDVPLSGANSGDGTCPELSDAGASNDSVVHVGEPATVTPRVRSTRPATSRGAANDEIIVRPPRWHSFLPGMFR